MLILATVFYYIRCVIILCLLNNGKGKQFKKSTELLSSKLSHSCQSLSSDRYASGCVTFFVSSVFKIHLTLIHPVVHAKIVSSTMSKK